MGMIMAAFSVASVFGVPFGLYIANHFNWHGPFIFVAALGALLVPLVMHYMPKMNAHLKSGPLPILPPAKLIGDIFKDSNQLLALSLSACLMMGHFMIIPFLNPFMEFNMGYSKSQTPMIYMVGGALTLFSSPLMGKLADKIGKHRLFIILVLVSILPIALITNLPKIPFYVVLSITGFWFVVSSGRSIPAQAMISNVVPPERRGSFMSFNASVQQIFVGLASVIAGIIVVNTPDNKVLHYEMTGYLSIGIILLSILIAGKLHTKQQENNRLLREYETGGADLKAD